MANFRLPGSSDSVNSISLLSRDVPGNLFQLRQ